MTNLYTRLKSTKPSTQDSNLSNFDFQIRFTKKYLKCSVLYVNTINNIKHVFKYFVSLVHEKLEIDRCHVK